MIENEFDRSEWKNEIECDMNECGIERIGKNDKGEPRHGKWSKNNVSWWMKGMVKGYEGPNDMVSDNGEPRTMFQRSNQQCPIPRI